MCEQITALYIEKVWLARRWDSLGGCSWELQLGDAEAVADETARTGDRRATGPPPPTAHRTARPLATGRGSRSTVK
jgi:hypothetical protein